MATDSLIGYAAGTIDSLPATIGTTNSLIGWAAGTIENPATPGATNSPVGYTVGTILDAPTNATQASPIGYNTDTTRSPAYPIGVLRGTTIVQVPIEIWTGTTWAR